MSTAISRLRVTPQTLSEYPRHKWEIWSGDTFGCYGQSRMGMERAKKEIEANLAKHERRLSQVEIDTRPTDQEPQGIARRLFWRASQRQAF